MNGLIRASLRNPIAVTVMVAGARSCSAALAASSIPIDILPVFRSPAVQTLVFYSGMPAASIEKNITSRLERGVVQASGGRRIESRSIVGDEHRPRLLPQQRRPQRCADRGQLAGRLGVSHDAAGHAAAGRPALRPDERDAGLPGRPGQPDPGRGEPSSTSGRYEVRPQIMSQPGALAPLVYGGKVRAIMIYLDRVKLQARHLSPLDVMKAVDEYNVFLPTGSAKFGTTDYAIDCNSMFDVGRRMEDIPLRNEHGNAAYLRDVGDAQGRQLHPDQRRAGQRQAAGLHPRLPPARRQHPPGRRHAQGGARDDEGAADPRRASTSRW